MPNTQPNSAPDYLILGSGLAGLSFAALMAKAGKKVKVLEAHEFPGGTVIPLLKVTNTGLMRNCIMSGIAEQGKR
ncbi:NAD(P)-binding protein [Methyloprofundus sedimenti]|uniref:NAD(P)-binding protein n=1 Tax=Methyloprofundus sedimenti TaxID=1420851 RepID=UPI0018E99BCE|nr:NAD(P)-binding protein [Methyloprofundus sedimenti]